MVKIKKPYDVIEPVVFHSDLPSETKQSMKAECDLNELIKKYPNMLGYGMDALENGQFASFTDLTYAPEDLSAAMSAVEEVRDRFMALPSAVRDRFGSNPLSLLEFLSNPQNDDEAIKLGLKIKPEISSADAEITFPATPVAEEVK